MTRCIMSLHVQLGIDETGMLYQQDKEKMTKTTEICEKLTRHVNGHILVQKHAFQAYRTCWRTLSSINRLQLCHT